MIAIIVVVVVIIGLLLPFLSEPLGLFQWVGSLHQVAKVFELQFQYQFRSKIQKYKGEKD